jgi:UDP-N-acetylglucosamine 2-epimerase (non-hydrolysing)
MKMAPVVAALTEAGSRPLLVHTGQHYDQAMSQVFFDQLGMPTPDIHLEVGSDTHARQTARIMTAFEPVLLEHRPDWVVVAGDVNSTVATGLVAAKLEVPVAHVEAGLRSFDRTMPEEINRVLTDHLSDLLFTTEESGNLNLQREGIPDERVAFVGNCMVDSLRTHVEAAIAQEPWQKLGLTPGGYALMTLHRPSNVDDPETLRSLISTASRIAEELPVVFPLHPRTRQRLDDLGLAAPAGLRLEPPLPYLSFLGLMARARCVLTDSGGIQEETTALSVPCLTLRWNTERPSTVDTGTNRLVGTEKSKILAAFDDILGERWQQGEIPPLWDGRAGERIAERLLNEG